MNKVEKILYTVLLLMVVGCWPAFAADTAGEVLPSYKQVDISTSDGTIYTVRFDDEGGLNSLHLTTIPEEPYGQVTTTNRQTGTIYVSYTGGRGFNDRIILMIAVNGSISDDFALHLISSGYQWSPTPILNIGPAYDDLTYAEQAAVTTLTAEYFTYASQTWKPAGIENYPIYFGQNTSDASNGFSILFFDTKAGNLGVNSGLTGLRDQGAVKIEYAFENLSGSAVFNAYAWCNQSNEGEGISWTNRVVDDGKGGSSGYTVLGSGLSPDSGEFITTVSSEEYSPTEETENQQDTPKNPIGLCGIGAGICGAAVIFRKNGNR
ncbi:hypothetical protein Mlab_0250 [Methanocorpusculum labreanum Z]|uniref:Uncharacterized protein n=1 Tax=Methanocorpusculum labreanum (strain ATCC 43576 / DSM 4855 / Z) TaxID=410358 RepID=A2SQ20_METLZ|nr:hypothetical protein [Methanocorpusculum labreanum]ABN06426.1 hypothetical protein Mlab_0250 [Methanocorpusculum labreanum Z]